jgi:S-adenosylmethionine:tRNA ribosyltransferase-isomerase
MSEESLSLEKYQFDLPDELIAQKPCEPRDSARLLVVEKKTGSMFECRFSDIKELLDSGDILVANESRVIPARLIGKKKSGATIEALLIEKKAERSYSALVRPADKVPPGTEILFEGSIHARCSEALDGGMRCLVFEDSDFEKKLERFGHMPLPPYIRKGRDVPEDRIDYQTVFAKDAGSIAAPTAGLHFTPQVLASLQAKGVEFLKATLHVGIGTFLPIRVSDVRQHKMHKERYSISPELAARLNGRDRTKKCIVVGTTTVRALESACDASGTIVPGSRETDLFIYPGYRFRFTEHLLTNFHLPGSTLLLMVSALLGRELTLEVYKKAVERRFRFFSYGDCMLII